MHEGSNADRPVLAIPTASNPWVQGSAAVDIAALAVGLLLAVLEGPSGYAADGGPAAVRLVVGAGLGVVGLGLLLSALVISGVGWYLRHPRHE